jgi:hypothetical protein
MVSVAGWGQYPAVARERFHWSGKTAIFQPIANVLGLRPCAFATVVFLDLADAAYAARLEGAFAHFGESVFAESTGAHTGNRVVQKKPPQAMSGSFPTKIFETLRALIRKEVALPVEIRLADSIDDRRWDVKTPVLFKSADRGVAHVHGLEVLVRGVLGETLPSRRHRQAPVRTVAHDVTSMSGIVRKLADNVNEEVRAISCGISED